MVDQIDKTTVSTNFKFEIYWTKLPVFSLSWSFLPDYEVEASEIRIRESLITARPVSIEPDESLMR